MSELTTAKFLEVLGLSSARTLQRWQKSGLIPEPELRASPSGRGRAAYWSAEAVHRGLEVRRRVREGQTLAQIKRELGEERRDHSNQYVFAEISLLMDEQARLQRQQERLTVTLRKFCRRLLEASDGDLFPRNTLERMDQLHEGDQQPTLLIIGRGDQEPPEIRHLPLAEALELMEQQAEKTPVLVYRLGDLLDETRERVPEEGVDYP